MGGIRHHRMAHPLPEPVSNENQVFGGYPAGRQTGGRRSWGKLREARPVPMFTDMLVPVMMGVSDGVT
jgi:hypothetical protein